MRFIRLLILLFFMVSSVVGSAQAAEPLYVSEHKARATFIYHLVDYIEWRHLHRTEVTLCITGYDSVYPYLQKLSQVPIGGISLDVMLLRSVDAIDKCQMLYVGQNMTDGQFTPYLEVSNSRAIVTLSAIPDFTSKGGMLGFSIIRNRVKLTANAPLIKSSGVRLNPALLHILR